MFLLANMTTPAMTGDNANIFLYVILGLIAAAVVVLLTFKDKILKKTGSDEKQQKAAEEQWARPDSEKDDGTADMEESAGKGAEDDAQETKEQSEDQQ